VRTAAKAREKRTEHRIQDTEYRRKGTGGIRREEIDDGSPLSRGQACPCGSRGTTEDAMRNTFDEMLRYPLAGRDIGFRRGISRNKLF